MPPELFRQHIDYIIFRVKDCSDMLPNSQTLVSECVMGWREIRVVLARSPRSSHLKQQSPQWYVSCALNLWSQHSYVSGALHSEPTWSYVLLGGRGNKTAGWIGLKVVVFKSLFYRTGSVVYPRHIWNFYKTWTSLRFQGLAHAGVRASCCSWHECRSVARTVGLGDTVPPYTARMPTEPAGSRALRVAAPQSAWVVGLDPTDDGSQNRLNT